MWSSILNEEGLAQCHEHMSCLEPAVTPCVNSGTIGSVVAALLIANLVGHRDDSAHMFERAIPVMVNALLAAFDGQEYEERKWGPGPVAKSFASLTVSELNKERVYDLKLLPLFTQIVVMGNSEWKVSGFDDEYFMGAKASACKVIWNLSLSHDVEHQCPDVLDILQNFLSQEQLSALARANAEMAAFSVARYRVVGPQPWPHQEVRGAGAGAEEDISAMVGSRLSIHDQRTHQRTQGGK